MTLKSARISFLPLILISVFLLSITACSSWDASKAKRYAIVIGIADYMDPSINDLNYTDDDAMELKSVLKKDGWEVKQALYDAGASFTAIKNSIIDSFSDIPVGSTVLIYYSGHGTITGSGDTGKSAIVPYDYTYLTHSPLIEPSELSSWIAESAGAKTDNIIVILDSCNSGGFVAVNPESDSIPDDYNNLLGSTTPSLLEYASDNFGAMLAKNFSVDGLLEPIVLSAAGYGDLSFEISTLKHGIFTYALMRARDYGDRNGDGLVTCTEAYTYAARYIDRNWNTNGSAQAEDEYWEAYYASNNQTYTDNSYYLPHMTGSMRDLVLFAPGK